MRLASRRVALLALSILGAAPPLQAQESQAREGAGSRTDPSVRIQGRVVDQKGQASPHARVTLLRIVDVPFAPLRFYGRLNVTADAQGRLRARCQRGRRYVAWSSRRLSDASYASSELIDLPTESPVVLTEVDASAQTIDIQNPRAWRSFGPIRYEAWIRIKSRLVPAGPVRKRGAQLLLPAIPKNARITLRVIGPNGVPVASIAVADSTKSLELLEPRRVGVRVLATDAVPIAGATVLRTSGRLQHVLGVTDGDGEFHDFVARWRSGERTLPTHVKYGTMGLQHCVCYRSLRFSPDDAEPFVTLAPTDGDRVRARVLIDGKPVVGAPVYVYANWKNRGTEGTNWAPLRLQTDHEGRIELLGRRRDCPTYAYMLLDDATRRQLRGENASTAPMPDLVPLIVAEHPEDGDFDDLHLDRLQQIECTAATTNGIAIPIRELRLSPIRRALEGVTILDEQPIRISRSGWSADFEPRPPTIRSIASTRVRLLLPTGRYKLAWDLRTRSKKVMFPVPLPSQGDKLVLPWPELSRASGAARDDK